MRLGWLDKELAVVIDLDGTLLDGTHRHHLVTSEKPKDFKKYRLEGKNDNVNKPLLFILKILTFLGIRIILLTGRDNKARYATVQCLKRNEVPYHCLCMRNNGDTRSDYEFKKDYYNRHIKSKYHILFTVEDRPSVVRLWKELKIFCFYYRNPKAHLYESLADAFVDYN